MKDSAFADRLVSYADALAALAFVSISGLGVAAADPDIRCSLAHAAFPIALSNVFSAATMTGIILGLRRWERDLRKSDPPSERAEGISRHLHRARIFIVWLAICVPFVIWAINEVQRGPNDDIWNFIMRVPSIATTDGLVKFAVELPATAGWIAAVFALLLATSSYLKKAIQQLAYQAWQLSIQDVKPRKEAKFDEKADRHLNRTRWGVRGLRVATAVAVFFAAVFMASEAIDLWYEPNQPEPAAAVAVHAEGR